MTFPSVSTAKQDDGEEQDTEKRSLVKVSILTGADQPGRADAIAVVDPSAVSINNEANTTARGKVNGLTSRLTNGQGNSPEETSVSLYAVLPKNIYALHKHTTSRKNFRFCAPPNDSTVYSDGCASASTAQIIPITTPPQTNRPLIRRSE